MGTIGSPPPNPGTGGNPVILSSGTFDRHETATQYVEHLIRSVPPRVRRGKTTTPSSGAWGYLQPGDTITGMDGSTLGEGDVILCSRDGADLTPDGDKTHVYNHMFGLTAGSNGVYLRLTWMDGNWCPVLPAFAVGKASGAISPRVGSDYGGGTVEVYTSDSAYGYGSAGEDGPLYSVDVLNASADTMGTYGSDGISDGIYCSIACDAHGNVWVAPLECG